MHLKRAFLMILTFALLCSCQKGPAVFPDKIRLPQGPFRVSVVFSGGVSEAGAEFTGAEGEYRLLFTSPEHLSGMEAGLREGQVSFHYRGLDAGMPDGLLFQGSYLRILADVFEAASQLETEKEKSALSIRRAEQDFVLELDPETGYPLSLAAEGFRADFSGFSPSAFS